MDTANLVDDGKIRVIKDIIRAREQRERQTKERERQEKERVEREIRARIWKEQQEQRERERLEALKAHRERERAAEQRRQEEQARQRQKIIDDRAEQTRQREKIIDDRAKAYREQYEHPNLAEGSCYHDGWWPKVQGRTACPECNESWTYLLQCPSCMTKACPRCRSAIGPRMRNTARRNGRIPPRAPSQNYFYDY